jgi:hypothetical protein
MISSAMVLATWQQALRSAANWVFRGTADVNVQVGSLKLA